MIELGLKVTLAYLVGAVLGSLVVGFLWGGVDIRKQGSGNAGGTNALRTQGKVFALWVMVIDVGKGILAAALIPPLDIAGVGIDAPVDRSLVLYSVAFAAIVGHVFPVWFGFRGGKGGATAAGLICYLAPAAALPVLGALRSCFTSTLHVSKRSKLARPNVLIGCWRPGSATSPGCCSLDEGSTCGAATPTSPTTRPC